MIREPRNRSREQIARRRATVAARLREGLKPIQIADRLGVRVDTVLNDLRAIRAMGDRPIDSMRLGGNRSHGGGPAGFESSPEPRFVCDQCGQSVHSVSPCPICRAKTNVADSGLAESSPLAESVNGVVADSTSLLLWLRTHAPIELQARFARVEIAGGLLGIARDFIVKQYIDQRGDRAFLMTRFDEHRTAFLEYHGQGVKRLGFSVKDAIAEACR